MSAFDLEHLQKLSYERSKAWATFLDNVCKNETHQEIHLNDLEEVMSTGFNEEDNEEELASMEDDDYEELSIDSGILRNVTNTTRFSILFNNTLALPESTGVNNENHKFVDIFNQTMPIINEHHRQLKESGFDRIFNTFDKKKIEEKVGSWLSRHNSLYGGDATLTDADYKDTLYQKSSYERNVAHQDTIKTSRQRNCRRKLDESNDSEDSLHSGETARYIRSSRTKGIKMAISSSGSTIKTYRMVKSKREALREKYACEQDDETHLKTIRHRRRIATSDLEHHHHHNEHGRLQRPHKYEMYTTPSKHSQKRKVLRKRTANNSYTTLDTSSDSDNCYCYAKDDRGHRKQLPCCSQHYCTPAGKNYAPKQQSSKCRGSAMKMTSARSNRIYYYSHSHSLSKSVSSSSSSTSFTTTCEKRRLIKRNCRFYNDDRPCRRESECRCCNDRKLCQDYKHVADTSTEEWFVENCYSPQKEVKAPFSKSKPLNTVAEVLSPLNEKERYPQKRNRDQKTKLVDSPPKQNEVKKAQQKSDQKPKATKTKKKTAISPTTTTNPDDTFNMELQMAIEASKKLYEQEQKNEKPIMEIKKQREILKTKNLRKTKKDKLEYLAILEDEQPKKNKTEEQREIIKTKNLRKITKKDKFEDLTILEDEQPKINLKRPTTEISTTIFKDEIKAKLPKLIEKGKDTAAIVIQFSDEEIFVKPQLKSLSKPLRTTSKKPNNSTITSTVETFLPPTQPICNSTALSDDTQAYNRQFAASLCIQNQSQKQKDDVNENITTKPLRKLPRNKPYEEQDSTDSEVEQTIEVNKKNRKKKPPKTASSIFEDDITKLTKNPDDAAIAKDLTDDEIFVKPLPRPMSKRLAETTIKSFNSNITSTEETFFAHTQIQGIRNSTAMPNDTQVYNRQFANSICNQNQSQIDEDNFNKSNNQQQTEDNKNSKNTTKTRTKKSATSKKTASSAVTSNNTIKSQSSKKKATSTVTSTTIRSPYVNSTSVKTAKEILDLETNSDENSDCTLVTSTTNIDIPNATPTTVQTSQKQQQQPQTSSTHLSSSLTSTQHYSAISSQQNITLPSSLKPPPHNIHHPAQTQKGILIYAPQYRSLAPAHSFSNDGGHFNITKEHLTSIIGEKPTEKFLKYYVGRRRFNSNSTIYFKPPSNGVLDTNASSSSESDDDLDCLGRYGDLYESFNKTTKGKKHA